MKTILTSVVAGMLLVSSTFVFAQDVYATKNGKKYHKADCLLVKDKGAKPIALEDAQNKALQPCHRCFGNDDTAKAQAPVQITEVASK